MLQAFANNLIAYRLGRSFTLPILLCPTLLSAILLCLDNSKPRCRPLATPFVQMGFRQEPHPNECELALPYYTESNPALPANSKPLCSSVATPLVQTVCEQEPHPDECEFGLQALIHPGLHGPAPQQPLQHHGCSILLNLPRLSRQQQSPAGGSNVCPCCSA